MTEGAFSTDPSHYPPPEKPEELELRIHQLNTKVQMEMLRRKSKNDLAAIINLELVQKGQSPMTSEEISNQVHEGLVIKALHLFSESTKGV